MLGLSKPFNIEAIQCAFILLLAIVVASKAHAIDVVKVSLQQSDLDVRIHYKYEVIRRALDITTPEFGLYEFKIIETSMSRSRALRAIQDGETINLHISLANTKWNNVAIPIKIPLRLGLLSYRLLLVNQDYLSKFKQVNTLEDLKELSIGLQTDWVITDTFKKMGFNVVDSSTFDSTFLMLQFGRFDYVPRGINEIYDELEARAETIKDIVVEPTLALYFKVATYAYVSPQNPRLAKRVGAGLKKMLESGELERILNKYYANDIKKANLANRKIIEIENPDFVDKEIINNESLWLSPLRVKQ